MAISRIGGTVGVTTPAWLYELLPLIYIAGGFLAAATLGGMLAVFSGAILVGTGMQVLRMRNRYRKSMTLTRRMTVRSYRRRK